MEVLSHHLDIRNLNIGFHCLMRTIFDNHFRLVVPNGADREFRFMLLNRLPISESDDSKQGVLSVLDYFFDFVRC